jgi:Tol biopolymer transport system component/DNA-binding winged helix-turn-helix (wHTH) protein
MSLLINHSYRFGEFTLDTDQRILLRKDKPLALAPKVFDTLLMLVQNGGRIIEKEELMNRLWPETFVEDGNLTYNIKQLRKTLGDDARRPRYVETIARRGYRFIANVEEVLSDSGPMSDQITQRFKTAEAQSPVAADRFKGDTEAQKPEPAIEFAIESQPAISPKHVAAIPASDAASISISTRSVALAVALLIVLVGGGFVLWKFSNGSDKDLRENKKSDSQSQIALPLKVEKLTATGQSKHVAISPDGKYVAYTHDLEKKKGIWLRQLATNTNIEIVPATSNIYGLAFANTGEYIYFIMGDPTTGLHRVSLLGGVPTRIIAGNLEGKFSISPDDSQIAFIRQHINRDGQREYSLMIANSDGRDERTLLVATHPDKLDVPLWSPDGGSIICAYGNWDSGSQDVRIVEVGVTDGRLKELSSNRFSRITKMAWLPHQSGLIMCAAKADENQLWRLSYPSLEVHQITEGLSSYLDLSLTANADKAVASQATRNSDIWVGSSREPQNLKKITQGMDELCWTPNGRLVYSSTASGNKDLWIMQPDGTEERQLTLNAKGNSAPAVTPDNRYIVFTSNRTGALQIWRMNIDGGNQLQLTDGAGKNFPSISPDGRWVFYNTTDDWHLWKVSIDGGEPSQLTDYIASHAGVSPDGTMIACVGRNESKRELLVLPFEGGQPLRKFDFAAWSSRIQWTPDGKALIYAVEQDGGTAIVKQSLNGGPPEKVADFDEDELFDFGYSFDAQFLAVTRGGWQHDVVLISDLNRH